LLIGRSTFIPENPGLYVLEFKGARHTVQIDVPKAESPQPIVSLRDVDVEVETEKEVYFLGENFTATIYLVNNRSEDVWLKPISEFSINAFSVNDPEPVTHGLHITWEEGALIHVPAGSRTRLIEERITPKYPGAFNINCLGAHLSLDVIDPEEMWLDDDSIVVKIILGATNIRETDRDEYVAISPDESERGVVKVEIKLGEIVKGEGAKMVKGKEFMGNMTAYVRYFQVKRLRIKITPPRIIGERHGWIDMLGRCYVYEGWDEV
jgi:hypothetical protein